MSTAIKKASRRKAKRRSYGAILARLSPKRLADEVAHRLSRLEDKLR